MEKFGIFSLLSALAGQNEENKREETPTAPADSEKPRSQAAHEPASPSPAAPDARIVRAGSFLEKHDTISRRIDKNNRH